MSNEIKDGGPAFPIQFHVSPNSEIHHGMSLRDWFASKALAALLAGPNCDACSFARGNPRKAATWAYDYADAMLAARRAQQNN